MRLGDFQCVSHVPLLLETDLSLPKHNPAPLKLSDCLSRIPKLTPIVPEPTDEAPKFQPKLSYSATDEFFMPKKLSSFMNRLDNIEFCQKLYYIMLS